MDVLDFFLMQKDGMSIAQIAEKTGEKYQTVRKLLGKLRTRNMLPIVSKTVMTAQGEASALVTLHKRKQYARIGQRWYRQEDGGLTFVETDTVPEEVSSAVVNHGKKDVVAVGSQVTIRHPAYTCRGIILEINEDGTYLVDQEEDGNFGWVADNIRIEWIEIES